MARFRNIAIIGTLVGALVLAGGPVRCQEASPAPSQRAEKGARLFDAAMCEGIQDFAPWNRAVVFSIGIGEVFCFTAFDPVPELTFATHNWFRRDSLVTRKRLTLKPPRWSAFSSIQLRQVDKGPWRVEIRDRQDRLLKVLRFSITD